MCVYLPTKFQVSSMILTSFKQGLPFPIPKWTPKEPTLIRNFLEGLLEEYSELCQASEIEFYVKIVNDFMQFTILEKSSILDIF